VKGQFFFLVDPEAIPEYPHIDVLSLNGSELPPDVATGPEPIQLYRYENAPATTQQQVEGLIQADAVAEKGGVRVVESGWFRYLHPGVDYFVHPSGLWIALRTPLARDEMLAVTYLTAAGRMVGDYNPERLYNTRRRPTLRLLKASAANHQPGSPTWEQEMHQVYRVSGSRDVERASVAVTISLGEPSAGRTFKRAPSGEEFTFLRLFGLDQEAPQDAVDPAFIYEPARDLFQVEPLTPEAFVIDQPVVQGTFVVFPTLRPFAAPPPRPAIGL
jgi:cell surface protein SprA